MSVCLNCGKPTKQGSAFCSDKCSNTFLERNLGHTHCMRCGKLIGAERRFCSTKCEQEFESIQKRTARWGMLFVVVIVVLLAVLLVLRFIL